MHIPIIISAVIAFLIVLCVIYFKEIKNYIKSKLPKKKSKKQEKPKQEKKQTLQVEDFKPILKDYEKEERDSSLDDLFFDEQNGENDEFSEINSVFNESEDDFKDFFTGNFGQKMSPTNNKFKSFNDLFESKAEQDNRPISEKIKSLPPEIKALIIDNVLKKRDDV